MIGSDYLLRFDLFQQLVLWLHTSMCDCRKGRHALEENRALLDENTDRELDRLIAAQVEETIELKQQMQHLQALLRNARHRGKTANAIAEAYVNTYGGFALDIPPWLEKLEEQCTLLARLRRPERTSKTHIALLQDALVFAATDEQVAPEVLAELQSELGNALLQSPRPRSHAAYVQALETAMKCYESALKIYTYERYPFQYAKVHIQLGQACQQYGVATGQAELVEQAIRHYKAALWVYHPETFPEQWSMTQTYLGTAYTQLRNGKARENFDYAISCHRAALRVVPQATFPGVWAKIQINLGDAYRQRIAGDRSENLALAKSCYRAALRVFTRRPFYREWAAIHTKLAFIFQYSPPVDEQQRDMALRCAIVCYEGAMEVYTPDAFPVERAASLVSLGNAHRKREEGERRTNLELAINCYRKALQIFSKEAFPAEYRQTYQNLLETEKQLKEYQQRKQAKQTCQSSLRALKERNTINHAAL